MKGDELSRSQAELIWEQQAPNAMPMHARQQACGTSQVQVQRARSDQRHLECKFSLQSLLPLPASLRSLQLFSWT